MPWIIYSKVFIYLLCFFAVKGNCNLGKFVCVKFNQWSKKTLTFASHNVTDYHNRFDLKANFKIQHKLII